MAIVRNPKQTSSTIMPGPTLPDRRMKLSSHEDDDDDNHSAAATLPLDESQRSIMSHFAPALRFSGTSTTNLGDTVTPPPVTTTTTRTTSSSNKAAVHFGTVHIHCHAYEMGDNPSVSGGVPVTIDWKALESYEIDLDLYEQHKPRPRPKEALVLPSSLRSSILRNHGFSRGELQQAAAEAGRIGRQRERSSRDGRLVRTVARYYRNLFTSGTTTAATNHTPPSQIMIG